ncbi:hypothetical protein HJC23_002952 [Cyclotella cryptica]|uniref:PNPLA domain-containing protein n=1 Tax=Cyclotella cryptica TaxID=29204 RepID=A0ABD3PE89_9STRA
MVAISNFSHPASVGYSFSPGGLLFPYHLGVITSLNYHKRLPPSVHLAGASAGAIAVAAHASQTPPEHAFEAAHRVCEECRNKFNGRAIGNLLPLLKVELDKTFSQDAHVIVNEREGIVALAHRELFPNNRPVLTTSFDTRDDLIEAVCDSSMFPFFSTPFPVKASWFVIIRPSFVPYYCITYYCLLFLSSLATHNNDVTRERYGCPDFAHLNFDSKVEEKLRRLGGVLVDQKNGSNGECNKNLESSYDEYDDTPVVERTITVACFPHETVGLTASLEHDQISPAPDYEDPIGQMTELFRYATQPSSREELHELYEKGWADAEKWSYEEDLRDRELMDGWLQEQREKSDLDDAIKEGKLF